MTTRKFPHYMVTSNNLRNKTFIRQMKMIQKKTLTTLCAATTSCESLSPLRALYKTCSSRKRQTKKPSKGQTTKKLRRRIAFSPTAPSRTVR